RPGRSRQRGRVYRPVLARGAAGLLQCSLSCGGVMQRYRNQILAGLLFISMVLIAVIAITGAGELASQLHDFPLWIFIPVFLLKCVNWALRYIEWRYFLGVIGVRTVRRGPSSPGDPPTIRERDSVVLWLAGLTLSISPGKLAEVLKALVLKNLTGME